MNGVDPPVILRSADPSFEPHDDGSVPTMLVVRAGGSVMRRLVEAPAQPTLSTTWTVTNPALNPVTARVVSPVDQRTEIGGAPPVITIEAVPSDNPHRSIISGQRVILTKIHLFPRKM